MKGDTIHILVGYDGPDDYSIIEIYSNINDAMAHKDKIYKLSYKKSELKGTPYTARDDAWGESMDIIYKELDELSMGYSEANIVSMVVK